jgi:serine/threonine protein kinase/Tol biopolymer transport system component
MDPQRWAKIESLYHAALAKDGGERSAYLDRACAQDSELRGEVESLLGCADAELVSPVADGNRLPPGFSLGAYEILAPLGAGGMGEVYRARDTKLKRDVALKVLPDAYARDPERIARFQREAEVLASLNHPNIAHIYGVEERALVMEMVEGDSSKGPMPFDDAWKVAMQIADALAYAHERGVIHRDLKPANVKVTPDGVVKLLDFGLAKAFSQTPDSASTDPEKSPTLTLGATVAGTVLGTAAYMSPEQAKGKRVDKRADIWSWGVVLYELLTGERLFKGEDTADTLAQVLTQEPDLNKVPARVRRLLSECLQKDPKQRLRDIGDAKRLLDESPAAAPSISRRGWIAAAALVPLSGGLGVVAWKHFREGPPLQRTLRLSVPLPANTTVNYFALSPDGRRLALALSREGKSQIYLRPLDSNELHPLPGTTGVTTVGGLFWSPDSRFIGFFADARLKIIPALGGPAQVLCVSGGVGAGTWNRKSVILFATDNGSLRRADADGGECRAVGKQVGPDNDIRSFFPTFLPDGNHFFYARRSPDPSSSGAYLATLDEPTGHRVLADLSNIIYAPAASAGARAHLLFKREDMLMAQPFAETTLQPADDPFTVFTDVGSRGLASLASAGADGTLVYLAGASGISQLTWYDRGGTAMGKVGPQAVQLGMAMSPDGKTVAMLRQEPNSALQSLWLHDLASGFDNRVDTPPGGNVVNGTVWSPDSRFVWFVMRSPQQGIYQQDRAGGSPQLLQKLESPISLSDRNERFLVYSDFNETRTLGDIWAVPVESGKPGTAPMKLVGTDVSERFGQISPDGKWLAYRADEAGTMKVYIRSFPKGPGAWPVLGADPEHNLEAFEPRWSPSGKELYFLNGTEPVMLMAVAVEADGHEGLRLGSPQKLFKLRIPLNLVAANRWSYSPHPDGRFLVNALVEAREPSINVITNWQKTVSR